MTFAATSFDPTRLPMMKIYDFPRGPYPTRVRIALAEKNLQSRVQFVMVDLRKGEHKKPEFIASKNYSGTLPVLELDDGTCIAECTAITEYLDGLDGAPTLTGRTPREKGVIHMMSKRAELELLDAVSVYFHHGTPGLGPEVELYQNPEWGFRQRDKALRGMHYFDAVLKSQPYVAGEAFSMADITAIGGLLFASMVELPVPAECRALLGWYARMLERPSVKNQPAFAALASD
ncbi:glutathione S-transferase [Burkholderia humptydooensis]|uniref:Glutathione S-transferase n=2 Tax=Burkholderia humptydooensis TaxID=430531 RepID=A0A7U4P3H7_9BURK|nr:MULTISPECIES: glutathione S-transferase [Burkholderia]ALX42298.1 glutathione S-transferase [Burkholderia humptydooensis]EIP89009.1 Glutathione S-transferase, N-terminal domain protein [Burkholderia humptydooensis MSMB43]QPS42502.1 glutathione S-transferase [Burkholderia humptydooensis]